VVLPDFLPLHVCLLKSTEITAKSSIANLPNTIGTHVAECNSQEWKFVLFKPLINCWGKGGRDVGV
jgi:hypothetical protein